MGSTLVLQSQRSPLPYPWIGRCLASVRDWCSLNRYEYRFVGDELFDCLPESTPPKTQGRPLIASDLARLCLLQRALQQGHARVVWMDADFLVFDPSALALPDEDCAVGRELWVQQDGRGRLKSYKKVHNAFMMFQQGNSFLDFYADTAARLLALNTGPMPDQFIGPKLLTALHNVVRLPVVENAGMLSPLVIRDMLAGQGPALELFMQHSPRPLAAANLCTSSCDRREVRAEAMERLIDTLLGGAGSWRDRACGQA